MSAPAAAPVTSNIAIPPRLRAHIKALISAGMSLNEIAAIARVTNAEVCAVLGAARDGIRPLHARALWSVRLPQRTACQPSDEPPPPDPTAIGTVRRLQALLAVGHGLLDLAGHLNTTPTTIAAIVFNAETGAGSAAAELAERTATVFSKLQMTRGSDQTAEHLGKSRSWPRPFDWDEDRIDQPSASAGRSERARRPDELAQLRLERQRRVAELVEKNWTSRCIAEHLKVDARTVQRDKVAIRRLAAVR